MILIIGKPYVHSHFQLHLRAISVAAHTFVELVEASYLSREHKVASSFHLLELGLLREYVGESIVEDRLHRCPYIRGTDGEGIDLNGFRLGVIDACAIEFIAYGTGCEPNNQYDGGHGGEEPASKPVDAACTSTGAKTGVTIEFLRVHIP